MSRVAYRADANANSDADGRSEKKRHVSGFRFPYFGNVFPAQIDSLPHHVSHSHQQNQRIIIDVFQFTGESVASLCGHDYV